MLETSLTELNIRNEMDVKSLPLYNKQVNREDCAPEDPFLFDEEKNEQPMEEEAQDVDVDILPRKQSNDKRGKSENLSKSPS